MLIACWSSKGGAGTTVVAAALGLVLAARRASGALLADLAGDLPAALGLPPRPTAPASPAGSPPGPTCRSTRSAASSAPPPRASALLDRGCGPARPGAGRGRSPRCSPPTRGRSSPTAAPSRRAPPLAVAAAADRSLLVTRPCFLALRRGVDAPRCGPRRSCSSPSRAARSTGATSRSALGAPVVAEVERRPGRGAGGRRRPARRAPAAHARPGAPPCRVTAPPGAVADVVHARLVGADPAQVGDRRAVAAAVKYQRAQGAEKMSPFLIKRCAYELGIGLPLMRSEEHVTSLYKKAEAAMPGEERPVEEASQGHFDQAA